MEGWEMSERQSKKEENQEKKEKGVDSGPVSYTHKGWEMSERQSKKEENQEKKEKDHLEIFRVILAVAVLFFTKIDIKHLAAIEFVSRYDQRVKDFNK
ncbi:hypothetical protein C0J52_08464 [Blattella germanica]|nr:hypothetical protein C0J52_08464 [Blattella germanica]